MPLVRMLQIPDIRTQVHRHIGKGMHLENEGLKASWRHEILENERSLKSEAEIGQERPVISSRLPNCP